MINWIDTHSHLYDSVFDEDRDETVQRATTAGITKIILPAIDSDTHPDLLDLSARYPHLFYPLMGLHPTSIDSRHDWRSELRLVRSYLTNSPTRFYGIGEIGLDLYWDTTRYEQQREAFETQLRWSLELDLPVVIHTREAWSQMTDVIRQFSGANLRGIFHSFCGTLQQYEQLNRAGDFLYGFGGVLTYKRSQTAELARAIPIERMVLETDCPYLSPVPHRGHRNESAYLTHTAQFMADLKGVSFEKLAETTTQNAEKLFRI